MPTVSHAPVSAQFNASSTAQREILLAAVLMAIGTRALNALAAQRVTPVVCRFQTEESPAIMDPAPVQKVFSAKPGMLDIEFDCSSGFASPISSYKEEHNTRPDPSNHVVARLFYPGCPESPADARQAYIPHANYAFGLAKFLTMQMKQWWAGVVRRAVAAVILVASWREEYPAEPARSVADISGMPVMVLSHGIGANRFVYSHFACQLAQHGVCVLAVEHTDGLGSAAKPAGARDWIYYKGWGEKEYLEECTRHRAAEVRTALRLVEEINSHGAAAEDVAAVCAQGEGRAAAVLDGLRGRLDTDSVVLCGHSYGGATVAEVAASLPPEHAPSAAIMIDPWYPAIPQDSAARSVWRSGCPALTLGSHAFNKAKKDGNLVCDGTEGGLQQAVLQGAARGTARGSRAQASVLLVPTDSPHAMVDDLGAMMMDKYSWMFSMLGRERAAGLVGGADLATRCSDAILFYFLRMVPLSSAVRATISAKLHDRWGAAAAGAADGGLAASLAAFFNGKRVCDKGDDAKPEGPGCAVLREIES
eukprot:jgi/Ulvmu1/7100/UM034_0004.1